MKNTTALLFLSVLSFLCGSAQTFKGQEAQRFAAGAKTVVYNPDRKSISLVVFEKPRKMDDAAQVNWLKTEVLKSNASDDLQLYQVEGDQIGFLNYRYRQLYKKIRVEDGVFYIHKKNGEIVSANGEFYSGIDINTTPAISKENAFQLAVKSVVAEKYIWDNNQRQLKSSFLDSTKLVIVKIGKQFALAYKADVYAVKPLSRQYIFIDANSGKVIKTINRIHELDTKANAVTAYSGLQQITTDSISAKQFFLSETGRGGGIETRDAFNQVLFADSDNFWNNNNFYLDNYAADVHFGSEKTYDFYKNTFNRNSLDNLGLKLISNVHVYDNYTNAFWDGQEMNYGDGDNVLYTPLTSLEIVGHELTHGVTQFSAGLAYLNESGALNESFSDIFGMSIRFKYLPATATWYCGDQIVKSGSAGKPFRNMSNPNEFKHPDTYKGLYFNTGDIVHYNSGVQNFWYYLLSTGGSGTNDIGNAYAVTGIGLADAIQIAYRNLTTYLTPNSTFADARTYSDQAAIDLFGECSTQRVQNLNAWYAVGVGGPADLFMVSFSSSASFSCAAPLPVSFFGLTTNNGDWFWDFGDGATSQVLNPVHTYTSPGIYAVKLIISGTGACAGAKDSIVKSAYVEIGSLKPMADFSVSPTPIGTNTPVNFNDQSSHLPTSWQWDFGDGATSTLQNPTHTYNSTGDFQASLIVKNCSNQADTVLKKIHVSNAFKLCSSTASSDATGFLFDSGGPTLDYGANEDCSFLINPTCSKGVSFTIDKVSLGNGDRLVVYDDATINPDRILFSSDFTPSPITLNGSSGKLYVVIHTDDIDNSTGFSASWTAIPSTQKPIAKITVDTAYGNDVGRPVQFFNGSSGGTDVAKWNFGDGGTSTLESPTHVYTSAGVYTLQLIVANCWGVDSATTSIKINDYLALCQNNESIALKGRVFDSGGPNGNYSADENCVFHIHPPCAGRIWFNIDLEKLDVPIGDTLFIYNSSPLTSTPYDTITDNRQLSFGIFSYTGEIFLRFVSNGLVNNSGFEFTWRTEVAVKKPRAKFSVPDLPASINEKIYLYDESGGSPSSWEWDFGDGTNGSNKLLTDHSYSTPGVYNIKLKVTNCWGSDSITKQITIIDPNSVSEISENNFANIYPNPANEKINIQLNSAETDSQVSLFSIAGELILQQKFAGQKFQIDVSDVSNGVYFIEVKNHNSAARKKVVISK